MSDFVIWELQRNAYPHLFKVLNKVSPSHFSLYCYKLTLLVSSLLLLQEVVMLFYP